MTTISAHVEISYLDTLFYVDGQFTFPILGRRSGPPEDCCPDEPGEWDDLCVYVDADGTDLTDFLGYIQAPNDPLNRTVLQYLLDEAEVKIGRAFSREL